MKPIRSEKLRQPDPKIKIKKEEPVDWQKRRKEILERIKEEEER